MLPPGYDSFAMPGDVITDPATGITAAQAASWHWRGAAIVESSGRTLTARNGVERR